MPTPPSVMHRCAPKRHRHQHQRQDTSATLDNVIPSMAQQHRHLDALPATSDSQPGSRWIRTHRHRQSRRQCHPDDSAITTQGTNGHARTCRSNTAAAAPSRQATPRSGPTATAVGAWPPARREHRTERFDHRHFRHDRAWPVRQRRERRQPPDHAGPQRHHGAQGRQRRRWRAAVRAHRRRDLRRHHHDDRDRPDPLTPAPPDRPATC